MAGTAFRSWAAGLLLAALLLTPLAAAAARTPLPMPGKQTLFQKVLTRPGVDLKAAAGAEAEVLEAALPAFSLFYVYGEQEAGGERWLEVGRKRDGTALGWLPAAATIEWKQTIVAAFSNPADRKRTLLFDERDALIELLESERVVPRSQELREQAIAGSLPADSHVVSIEPDTYIDIAEQFYLLPIIEFEEAFLASGFRSKILKVASVPLDIDPLETPPPSREELLKAFDAGIVFVIDTTTSMGPYIEATRNAIKRIYDAVAASEVGERVHFGLIGFRDNLELVQRPRVPDPHLRHALARAGPRRGDPGPRGRRGGRRLEQGLQRGFDGGRRCRDRGGRVAAVRRPLHRADHRRRAARRRRPACRAAAGAGRRSTPPRPTRAWRSTPSTSRRRPASSTTSPPSRPTARSRASATPSSTTTSRAATSRPSTARSRSSARRWSASCRTPRAAC